ncbi:MAG TPA: hypothetical protein VK465_15770 [Fibrobacteria bacterium]|nr:hypothetical protein [Fibrobacteria bacterium]
MKLSEFETRLSSVSDAKLRLMYVDSNEKGPAVAVDLIRAEANRRSLNLDSGIRAAPAAITDFDGDAADGLVPDTGTEAALAGEGETPEGVTSKGALFTEETTSGGLPVTVKILLAVATLGGIGVGVFMVLARG